MSDRKLSEKLQDWRSQNPCEWMMDDFIRDAKKLENSLEALREAFRILCGA